MAGQSGVADHFTVGDGATLTGKAGVMSHVAAGAVVSGLPAIAHREFLRRAAATGRLPDALRRITTLEERLTRLEQG